MLIFEFRIVFYWEEWGGGAVVFVPNVTKRDVELGGSKKAILW